MHWRVEEFRSRWLFPVTKYFSSIEVGDTPHFDEEGGAYFAGRIKDSKVYLEYGSGGSTVQAVRFVDNLTSVESDARYLDAVKAKIGAGPRMPPKASLNAVDIGVTGFWGIPSFRSKTPTRLAKWRAYPETGWQILDAQGLKADTILVDGRFRVACALLSFLKLGAGSPAIVMVDDYVGREHYETVARHGQLHGLHGRMAVFSPRADLDVEACRAAYEAACQDWR
jgi:hypothetical protein